jgi:hypothetical protein
VTPKKSGGVPLNQFVRQRAGAPDCVIAACATVIDLSYETLAAASQEMRKRKCSRKPDRAGPAYRAPVTSLIDARPPLPAKNSGGLSGYKMNEGTRHCSNGGDISTVE